MYFCTPNKYFKNLLVKMLEIDFSNPILSNDESGLYILIKRICDAAKSDIRAKYSLSKNVYTTDIGRIDFFIDLTIVTTVGVKGGAKKLGDIIKAIHDKDIDFFKQEGYRHELLRAINNRIIYLQIEDIELLTL